LTARQPGPLGEQPENFARRIRQQAAFVDKRVKAVDAVP
jgi:hypothetical protein